MPEPRTPAAAETVLGAQLADERARAIRVLLADPIIDVTTDRDAFTLVARHAADLTAWFDHATGWSLHVDHAVGYARLAKRATDPDPSRPLRRRRGARAPFDRRRYEILCLVCAELVNHPVTTVGLLARAVASRSGLDTARHRHRVAFVDALGALADLGVVRVSSGDVDDFVSDESANALLAAESSRLHRLLTTAVAPSRLDDGLLFDQALDALLAEPRYGEADRDDDHRRIRHRLARRLLDDPVVYLDDCTDPERAYLASGAGRQWLRDRVAEAGLELEERAEGLVAVNPTATATDDRFPDPNGTVYQVALLLVDELVETGADGGRRPVERSDAHLVGAIRARLDRHPGWARSHRDGDGPERLTAAAVDLLAGFGLCRRRGDTIEARPAICRYRAVEPTDPQMTLT